MDLSGDEHSPQLVWTLPPCHPMSAEIGSSYTKAIINVIERATKQVVMTSPFMQEHGISSLLKALIDALARGVVLTVLTHHAEDVGSSQSIAIEELRREAVRLGKALKIYTADAPVGSMLHAKVVIADEDLMVLGSANLTGPGLDRNVEAGVVLGPSEAAKALQVISRFDQAGLIRLVCDTEIKSTT